MQGAWHGTVNEARRASGSFRGLPWDADQLWVVLFMSKITPERADKGAERQRGTKSLGSTEAITPLYNWSRVRDVRWLGLVAPL